MRDLWDDSEEKKKKEKLKYKKFISKSRLIEGTKRVEGNRKRGKKVSKFFESDG